MATVLTTALADRGHRLTLFTTSAAAALPDRVASHDGIDLVEIPSGWEYDRWYSRTDTLKHLSGGLSHLASATRTARALSAAHERTPFDLVYQFGTVEPIAPVLAGRARPPLVVHPEVHAWGELRWLWRERALSGQFEGRAKRAAVAAALTGRSALQATLARRVDCFVAPADVFADLMAADYRLPRDRFVTAPNVIDLERFRPPPEGTPRTREVVMVARVAVRKGVDLAVEVARRLRDRGSDLRLVLLGDRSLWSDYRGLLAGLDPELLTWHGHVAPDRVRELLQRAAVVLQPSKYEPFALTVGEALACGTPVVTTEAVGASERVDPRVAARTPADAAALTEAVLRLTSNGSDPATRTLARREAERLFAPATVSQQIEAHLLKLVADSRKTAS
jgi:glycosyltransferase involved in cell wall biosynthesis